MEIIAGFIILFVCIGILLLFIGTFTNCDILANIGMFMIALFGAFLLFGLMFVAIGLIFVNV